MPIAYHNRRPIAEVEYAYAPSPLALAAMSDVLMVAVPGGTATRHIIGAAELKALGSGRASSSTSAGARWSTPAL